MTWKDWLPPIISRAIGSKSFTWSRTAGLFMLKGPVWANTADYNTLIQEGFVNSVVFSCIMAIARGAGSVPWTLHQKPRSRGGRILSVEEPHDLWTLLRRPNPWQAESSFREGAVAFYWLSGNTFISRTSVEKRRREFPQELSLLLPNKSNFAPQYDAQSQLIAYRHREYAPSGFSLPLRLYALPTFPKGQRNIDSLDGTSETIDGHVLHIRHFTPTNDWYAYSPVMAAAHSIDNFNAALAWNTALLQQYCRPSLVVTHEQEISPDDRMALEEMIESTHGGPQGAGRPLLLGGGLKAQEVGLGPREMEYLTGKEDAGLDICRVMNVPPEMVGFSKHKTYANYRTARKALYTEVIFPILELICNELTQWLLPLYDDRLVLGIDRDAVDAIREERIALFKELNNSWWLTINQRLVLAGLPDRGEEGEVLLVPNNLIPLQLALQPPAPAPDPTPEREEETDEDGDPVPKHIHVPSTGIIKVATNGAYYG